MMWEVCCDKVVAQGSKVIMNAPVTKVRWTPGAATSVSLVVLAIALGTTLIAERWVKGQARV